MSILKDLRKWQASRSPFNPQATPPYVASTSYWTGSCLHPVEYALKSRAETSPRAVADPVPTLRAEIQQLKFLLASAPMIEVSQNTQERMASVRMSRASYAYVHPKTMAMMTFQPVLRHVIVFPGSPTKWVLTSLMPEGRVIFSPLRIPGLGKILAQ